MRHLTQSEACKERPANQYWLLVALLRLQMRQGAKQLVLPVKGVKP